MIQEAILLYISVLSSVNTIVTNQNDATGLIIEKQMLFKP